jgi:hypothetical protein
MRHDAPLPFMDPRTARAPGLSPLDSARWLGADADFAAQMAERDRLIASAPPGLWGAVAGAEAAVAELFAAVLAFLATDARWHITARAVTRPDSVTVPLDGPALPTLGRLIQEDALLLLPGPDEYRLVAGILCFPSRWSLPDKLGRALTPVHGPVPHYADGLAARVNRVFAAIRPEAPLTRTNWTIHPTDTLHQPLDEREHRPAPPPLRGWFLRTERQGLRRLPATGAVAFTIKTTVRPLAALTEPERAALRPLVAGWDAAEAGYRGGEAARAAILAALG